MQAQRTRVTTRAQTRTAATGKQKQKSTMRTTAAQAQQVKQHQDQQQKQQQVTRTKQYTYQGSGHMPFVVLKVGLSAILYARGFFPREQYHTGIMIPAVLDDTQQNGADESGWEHTARTAARSKGDNSYRFMLLRRNQTEAGDAIMGALDDGVRDALDKGYLRSLIVGVSVDPANPMSIVEAYTFNFTYTQAADGSFAPAVQLVKGMNDLGLSASDGPTTQPQVGASTSTSGAEGTCTTTAAQVAQELRQTMLCIADLTKKRASLSRVWGQRTLTLKVLYYADRTPVDYASPGFTPIDSDSASSEQGSKFTFATAEGTDRPQVDSYGAVHAPQHTVSMGFASIAHTYPSDGSSQGEEEPMVEQEDRRVLWDMEAMVAPDEHQEDEEAQEAGEVFQQPSAYVLDNGQIEPIPTSKGDVLPASAVPTGNSASMPSTLPPAPMSMREPSTPMVSMPKTSQIAPSGTFELVGGDHGPPPSTHNQDAQTANQDTPMEEDSTGTNQSDAEIKCICGDARESGIMVQCESCELWSHLPCYGYRKTSKLPLTFQCGPCSFPNASTQAKHELSLVAQQRRAVTLLSALKVREAWPTAQGLGTLLGCNVVRAQMVLDALVDRGVLSLDKSGKAKNGLLSTRTRTALRAKDQLLAPRGEESKLLAKYGLDGDKSMNKSNSDQEIESDETLANQDDGNEGSGDEYMATSFDGSQAPLAVPSKSRTVQSYKQPSKASAKQATQQPSAEPSLSQVANGNNTTIDRTSAQDGNHSSNPAPAPMHVQAKRKYGLRAGSRKSFQFPRNLIVSQRTTRPTPCPRGQQQLPTAQPSQESDVSFDLTPSGMPRPPTQDSDPIQSLSPTGKTRAQQQVSKAGAGKGGSKRTAPIELNDDDDDDPVEQTPSAPPLAQQRTMALRSKRQLPADWGYGKSKRPRQAQGATVAVRMPDRI